MKTRTPHSLRTQSLARVSTLAAVATASGAHAAIVFNNTTITSSDDNSGGASVAWNIDGVGLSEAVFRNSSYNVTTSVTHYFKSLRSNAGSFKAVTSSGYLKGLGTAVTINASQNFAAEGVGSIFYSGGLYNVTNIASGVPTYIGFQFNPSGSLVLYGWADVTLTEGGSFGTFTINSWAYEDSGAAILTGDTGAAIPEPADYAVGLGALALGAAGLRRRRQARTVAA